MPESGSLTAALQQLSRLVGHTPLLALRYRLADGTENEVLVKCEQFNLTGSIKDRLALHALQCAAVEGGLAPGTPLLAEGGNLGISLAAMGKALGCPVTILLDQHTGMAFRLLVRDAGARLESFASPQELQNRREALIQEGYVDIRHWLDQDAVTQLHAQTTGRELGHSLILEKIRPVALLAGGESGAMLDGVAHYLQNLFPLLEARTAKVRHAEAGQMAGQLRQQLGLGCGYSAGANVLAAIRLQQQLGGKPVVTVICDDHKRYPELVTGKIEGIEFVDKRTLSSA